MNALATPQKPMKRSDIRTYMLRSLANALRATPLTMREFFREGWKIIEPVRPLIEGYYVDAIAEHLEAVDLGQISRLIINIQPRMGKSNLVSVLWPARSWTVVPARRFISASYAQRLSTKHSLSRRRVIASPWYQSRWGSIVRIRDDQNQKMEFENTARGQMMATSVGGSATGSGADVILADDIMNPDQAISEAFRETAINFFDQTLSTRLDDPKTGAIVVIEQRLHPKDLTGHLLAQGGYVHLCLPAVAPKRTMIEFPITKRQVVREEGELLCPERFGHADLKRLRVAMGSRGAAAQLDQNPSSEEGALFKRSWWRRYLQVPTAIRREWSWDTALEEGEENDYSVGILFAHCAQGTYIEKIVREKLQYPDLRRRVEEEWILNPAHILVIENKVSGISLAQDIKRSTNIPVLAYPRKGDDGKNDVRGDKVFRASLASPYVEAGRVFIPNQAPWIDEFITELAEFPNSEYKDQVDAFSQGINHYYQGPGRPVAAMSGGMTAPTAADWM